MVTVPLVYTHKADTELPVVDAASVACRLVPTYFITLLLPKVQVRVRTFQALVETATGVSVARPTLRDTATWLPYPFNMSVPWAGATVQDA